MKCNFNILVNSQIQCSQVIQTQAQKCDGMHINFDDCTYRLNLLWQANPPFWCADAQFILLRILRSSKYIKLIYVFGSAHVKIGVWIKAGPQPLFPADCQAWRMAKLIRIISAISNWFRRRTSHELNSLNLIWLMWSTASEPGLKSRD